MDLAHVGVLQNFADAVNGTGELYIDGREGQKSLTLSNAMYLSSWKKTMISLPQNEEEEIAFEKEYEAWLNKKKI